MADTCIAKTKKSEKPSWGEERDRGVAWCCVDRNVFDLRTYIRVSMIAAELPGNCDRFASHAATRGPSIGITVEPFPARPPAQVDKRFLCCAAEPTAACYGERGLQLMREGDNLASTEGVWAVEVRVVLKVGEVGARVVLLIAFVDLLAELKSPGRGQVPEEYG